MKKIIAISLMLLLAAVLFTTAFADPELTIREESLFIYDNDDEGVFFARVENTGDTGTYVGSGTLKIMDENGEVFIEANYMFPIPYGTYLEPGEYTYYAESIYDKQLLEKKAANFEFTVESRDYGSNYEEFPCDVELYYPGGENLDNTLFVTVTNISDSLLHDYYVATAIYDTDENLMYADERVYSDVGIHPGSTVTFSITIDSSKMKYYEGHGITPGKMDASIYLDEDY